MAPDKMRALVTGQRSILSRIYNGVTSGIIGHGAAVSEVKVPQIQPNELLVKVHYVACNPTDVLHIDIVGSSGSIVGCDYAGLVEAKGDAVTSGWEIGDRIAGVVHGGLYPDKGAFAQYLRVEADLAWKPPHHIADPEATTYGVSAVTAMQALYTQLDLPWPDLENLEDGPSVDQPTILVYAGSTAASLFAIQLAKLSGYKVVTTCSPHNFELVKRYGAEAAYDYHDQGTLTQIKQTYPGISRAFDGISTKESTAFCASVVQPAVLGAEENYGKVVVLLDTVKAGKLPGVKIIWILMYTVLGHPFGFFQPLGPKWPAVPEDRAALVRFYRLLPELVEKKLVDPPPTRVIKNGFDGGLSEGVELLRQKKVSGMKIVVDLE